MRRDDIRRLKEQRKSVHQKMVDLSQLAESEKRNLTGEETQQYEEMESEFRSLGERVDRGIQELIRDGEVTKELHTPIDKQINDEGVPADFAEFRKRRSGEKPWDIAEYRSAFYSWVTYGGDTSRLDVEEQRTLSKASGAAGAFLVPTDMAAQIIRATRFFGSVGQQANVINTSSGDTMNVAANTAHGVASWTAESAAIAQSDETFAQVPLNAFKLATSVIVSEELLEDSAFDLGAFLSNEFGERMGIAENTAFIAGSGTGQPQGIVGNISNTQAAVGNVTSFSYAALVTAIFTLPFQYRRNAVFIAADAAIRNLYLMVDSQQRPLWSVNVSTTGPDTFMGYPIYPDPDLATPAASAKSMIFGDVRRAYTIRRVDGMHMQRLNELFAMNGQVGFRGWERLDGRVVLSTAATTIQHSAT